jgi:hypothetical protein
MAMFWIKSWIITWKEVLGFHHYLHAIVLPASTSPFHFFWVWRIGDICDELEALEIEYFNHKYFVPLSKLHGLLTRDRVLSLLQKSDIKFYDRAEITDAALKNGLRLFKILASIWSINCIDRFMKSNYLSGWSLTQSCQWTRPNFWPFSKTRISAVGFFGNSGHFVLPLSAKINPTKSSTIGLFCLFWD